MCAIQALNIIFYLSGQHPVHHSTVSGKTAVMANEDFIYRYICSTTHCALHHLNQFRRIFATEKG